MSVPNILLILSKHVGDQVITYIGDDLTNESNLQETTVKNGNQIWRTMNRTDSYQLNFVANYNRTFWQTYDRSFVFC